MSASLKAVIRDHVADPEVSGLIAETEHEPLGGPAVPVAPPTYGRAEGDRSKDPLHAHAEAAFVPAARGSGWLLDLQREGDQNSSPRLAPRVVLDSYAAQSGRAETAVWNAQERLGLSLPAIVIDGGSATDETDAGLRDALSTTVSSWEAAHRHVDAWFRFATQNGAEQVWQQAIAADEESNLKTLIATAGPKRAELLYRYFPNASVYGFWLSSGVATRHRLARAYSSEIIGYGALPVIAGATKLDPVGGTSKSSGVVVSDQSLTVVPSATKGSARPSEKGFGQVPSKPTVRGYVCELIVQQSSLSLSVLRSLSYPSADQALAASTVLTLLAIAGRHLSSEDGFLRSGCALVPTAERWGWRRRGHSEPETLEITGVAQIADALRDAISDAEAAGLVFADPIRLNWSDAERQLIRERVREETQKTDANED